MEMLHHDFEQSSIYLSSSPFFEQSHRQSNWMSHHPNSVTHWISVQILFECHLNPGAALSSPGGADPRADSGPAVGSPGRRRRRQATASTGPHSCSPRRHPLTTCSGGGQRTRRRRQLERPLVDCLEAEGSACSAGGPGSPPESRDRSWRGTD